MPARILNRKSQPNRSLARARGPIKPTASAIRKKHIEDGNGLVLDDVLANIDIFRGSYNLAPPKFGLDQIEQDAKTKAATEGIINKVVALHGDKVYSKPHSIFEKHFKIGRGKWHSVPDLYSGWQIPRDHVRTALRLVLEQALQTIVQLPKKDKPLKDGTRELKLLASHCDKLAKELKDTVRIREICNRASVYFNSTEGPGLDKFFRQAEEMQRTARTIRTILDRTRLNKQKRESPNPQVRLALNVIGWLEAAGGKKQYEPFKTLLSAAFRANQKDTPGWVDRLEIEMTRRKDHREAWARSITV